MSDVFVCTYGQAGAVYGQAFYGLCGLTNAPSCAPAGDEASPETETISFTSSCDTRSEC